MYLALQSVQSTRSYFHHKARYNYPVVLFTMAQFMNLIHVFLFTIVSSIFSGGKGALWIHLWYWSGGLYRHVRLAQPYEPYWGVSQSDCQHSGLLPSSHGHSLFSGNTLLFTVSYSVRRIMLGLNKVKSCYSQILRYQKNTCI